MPTSTRTSYEDIGADELQRRVDEHGAAVVDVREPWEYARGHVPGAILIPLAEVPRRMDDIPDGAVLVCASGNRSGQACDFLARHGKTGLANLAEGTQGWIRRGLDIE